MFAAVGDGFKRLGRHIKKICTDDASIAEWCILAGQVGFGIYAPVRIAMTNGLTVNCPLIGSVTGTDSITLPSTPRTILLSLLTGYWAGGSMGNGIGQIIHAWKGISLNVTKPEGATTHPELSERMLWSNQIFLVKYLPLVTTAIGLYDLFHGKLYGGKPIFVSVEELSILEQIIETTFGALYFGRTLAVRSMWLDKLTDYNRVLDFGASQFWRKCCAKKPAKENRGGSNHHDDSEAEVAVDPALLEAGSVHPSESAALLGSGVQNRYDGSDNGLLDPPLDPSSNRTAFSI